jgi:hypothetical protein
VNICAWCGAAYEYCLCEDEQELREEQDWVQRLEDGMEMLYGFDNNYNPED